MLTKRGSGQIWNYLLRYPGSNTKLFHLRRRANSALSEQLLCALVRQDKGAATRIISLDPRLWLLPFLGLLQQNSLAGLASTLINQIGVRDAVADLSVSPASDSQQSEDGVWSKSTLAKNLQRSAGVELTRFDEFDDKFVHFLELMRLHSFEDLSLVWTKGVPLSRSIYQEPHQRLSSDFDFIARPKDFGRLVDLSSAAGYRPIMGDAGFCNQLEVGPTYSAKSLFLTPAPELVPSAVIGFERDDWPIIDPKFNPLDRGLVFREIERFYQDALAIDWRQQTFRAPSIIDHLLISLVHFEKDRFDGWKSLLDIHFLAREVDEQMGWPEFTRRCGVEGARLAAWAGLSIALDRFDSKVPKEALDELRPRATIASHLVSFSVEPLFYWNCASLPALFLNALLTEDTERKLRVLRHTLTPTQSFLREYCTGAPESKPLTFPLAWCLYWLVLVCPGIIIRQTFGRLLWPALTQYSSLKAKKETATQ